MLLRGCLSSVTVSDGVADWEPGLLGRKLRLNWLHLRALFGKLDVPESSKTDSPLYAFSSHCLPWLVSSNHKQPRMARSILQVTVLCIFSRLDQKFLAPYGDFRMLRLAYRVPTSMTPII